MPAPPSSLMTLPSATSLKWPQRPLKGSRAYWRCWPGWLIRGIAGVCATGWR
jgi:hypothetical protein